MKFTKSLKEKKKVTGEKKKKKTNGAGEEKKEQSPAPTEARMVPDARCTVSLPRLLSTMPNEKYFRLISDMQLSHLHLIGCSVRPLAGCLHVLVLTE